MAIIDFTPLGFSDPSSDEAFAVSVFGQWQSSGTICEEVESGLADMLRTDRFYDGLQLLFKLFGTFPDLHRRKSKNDSSVLISVGKDCSMKLICWTHAKAMFQSILTGSGRRR